MLAFYGFRLAGVEEREREREHTTTTTNITVVPTEQLLLAAAGGSASSSSAVAKRWVCPVDHNHLRITRMLRSLRVLGLRAEAAAFFAALRRVYDASTAAEGGWGDGISGRSMGFWERAATLPLHMAPDGTKVDWLRKYNDAEDEDEDN
ncbi:hypothetical protein GGR56DRAFT_646404, partial [Xylariaceae sp. FL0804]